MAGDFKTNKINFFYIKIFSVIKADVLFNTNTKQSGEEPNDLNSQFQVRIT